MTISFYTLAVTGPGKKPALLEFNGKSHLVFGPTDTGKSYIVECLRYCLGGDQRPKDVGYSEGYTRIALQVARPSGERFTFFRDLTDGSELAYPDFHIYPPQDGATPLEQAISDLLPAWSEASGKKILAKSGKLGNLTAGDLRRVSIFDEIETLDNAPFEGKDTNLKTRNRSALALILTGADDSDMVLPPTTDERNIAKGHVEALNEQIMSSLADVPEGLTKLDAEDGLAKVSSEIDAINQYLQSHVVELSQLKQERARIDNDNQALVRRISALSEAQNSFLLLDKKYLSDLQRLQAMGTAAAVMTSFETRPCPLCLTDMQHQARHEGQDEKAPILRQAALAESEKILGLREGLKASTLLRLLIESPGFRNSDLLINFHGANEISAKDFFVPLLSVSDQYLGQYHGFWGLLSGVGYSKNKSTIWFNSGGLDTISFCLNTIYLDEFIRRYRVRDEEYLAGAYILVFGTLQVAANGKHYCVIENLDFMALRLT